MTEILMLHFLRGYPSVRSIPFCIVIMTSICCTVTRGRHTLKQQMCDSHVWQDGPNDGTANNILEASYLLNSELLNAEYHDEVSYNPFVFRAALILRVMLLYVFVSTWGCMKSVSSNHESLPLLVCPSYVHWL